MYVARRLDPISYANTGSEYCRWCNTNLVREEHRTKAVLLFAAALLFGFARYLFLPWAVQKGMVANAVVQNIEIVFDLLILVFLVSSQLFGRSYTVNSAP